MKIRGANALVTGAGSGIGRASAIALARAGARSIVLADQNSLTLTETADAVKTAGSAALSNCIDLRDPSAIERLFADAERETGGLSIVHNNAGVMSGPPDFPDTHGVRIVSAVQVNLIAVILGTRFAIEHLRRRKAAGVIVNTASTAAFGPLPPDPVYSATKAAIVNFSASCAPLKERFNIRVVAICPGIVDTPIVQRNAEWLKPVLRTVKEHRPDEIGREVCKIIMNDAQMEPVILPNEQTVPG